jgi:hypothetical protein
MKEKKNENEPPKKSIAQRRLEQDLAQKEAEIRKIMNTSLKKYIQIPNLFLLLGEKN